MAIKKMTAAEMLVEVQTLVGEIVLGQQESVRRMLGAALVGGHALLEGVPGTAKTLLARAMTVALGLDFTRVQFTPDMLPSDLTGTLVLEGRSFAFRPGPVFTNVLLGDEINRTPPKTQSALLEAMQERQVTVDGETHQLDEPFLVVATQNPIEQEGTYPLPEAQLDRFHVRLQIGYPSPEDELEILRLHHRGVEPTDVDAYAPVANAKVLASARDEVDAVTVTEEVIGYVHTLVLATRDLPEVELGASPRASVHLLAGAKAAAALHGRDFATPDDVDEIAIAVLAHRLKLRPEAELEGYLARHAVDEALGRVQVPR